MTSPPIRLLAALAFTGSLCGLPSAARADAFEDAVRGLGQPDRAVASIAALGELGDARALPILRALEERRLRVGDDGTVYREDAAGALRGALDGAPAPEGIARPARVAVTNVVRRALTPALARLELGAHDDTVRAAAALALRQNPDPAMLPAMRAARGRERVAAIREDLTVAIALADLQGADRRARLAAIAVLDEHGSTQTQAPLERLVARDSAGRPIERDAQIRAAAQGALDSLSRRQWLIDGAAHVFYGLSLASVLLLAALGLAITFGLMRVINMAHGEMLMIGAYSTYVVQRLFQAHLPGAFDWFLALALPVAFLVCMAVGMVLERAVIRHLYGRPLETLLATWGISLMLIQTVRLVFGAQNVAVANPSWLSGGYEAMPGIVFSYNRIAIMAFVVGVVAAIALVLRRTSLGLHVRAVMQNRAMAASLGVRTHRVDLWTFGVGSGVAGLGGVALSQIGNVGPELGQTYIVDSFMVVVLGGVGKIAGTVVGAVLLGLVNKVLEPTAGAVLGKILVLVCIVLFIQARPAGLVALQGRNAQDG